MRRHARASSAGPNERKPSGPGSSSPARGRLVAVLAFAAALAVMAFSAASASATALPFKETFGSAEQPTLGGPSGMTVDPASGDLLVIDQSNQTLHRYKPNGEADNFSALGSNVIDGKGGEDATPSGEILSSELGGTAEVQVAVAPPGAAGGSAGDIYVTNAFKGSVEVFAPSGKYLTTIAVSSYPCGVATDPAGNLFIGDYEGSQAGVSKLTPTAPGVFTPSAKNPYVPGEAPICQVAADSGFVYATKLFSSVLKIASKGAKEGEVEYTAVATGSGPIAVNPKNHHLFVVKITTPQRIDEYDVSGASPKLVSETSVGSEPYGVAVDGKAHNVYVTRGGKGKVEVFELPQTGPTNRATLTLTKSAGGTGGIGSVTSKPKGINCASACNEAVASMYKKTPVVLKEKPSTGSTFVEWKGACSGSGETCTVPMAEAESVQAVFGGVSKEILNPQELTLSKGESTGQGTVKATGLTCELDCSSETALYQGPTGAGPKAKPGKTVVLKALAAYGSEFSGWSGCESNPTPSECSVTMEEAAEVTAEFAAKPTATLTVDKLGTGVGTVTSKPKAISCASTCTTQDATVPTGEAVILKEKPATGMTFEGWTGACVGAGETCTVSLSEAGTVHAKFGGSPKPIANPQELTLTKAGSGYGTIKATGLTCEVLCTSTVSLYQGPTGVGPKAKPGKTVVLKALSAPGSKQVEWSGCLSEPTPTECSVVMEEAEEVTATFDEIE